MGSRTRQHTPSASAAAPASRPWLHAALIAAAIALVYSNSLSGPFILDDADTIVTNAAVRDPGDIARVFAQARDTPLAGRPLVAYTFALNYAASGLAVQGYHATNIVIHILCALLLFSIVRETISVVGSRQNPEPGTRNPAPAALAVALVWALHPLNTEVVDYITQRTESMMALCLLASLYAAMRSLTERRTILWQTAAIAACACGMLCKETMVAAPLLIVLYDRAVFFGSLRGAFAVRWRLYGGLALTWLVLLAMMVPGPRAGSVGFGAAITPWEYLLNQAVMIAHYLGLAVWPRGLTVNYGPPLPYGLGDVWPQAALIFGLIAATLAAFRWRAALGFLGAWVFITLAPTSSFVPIATEVGAERRMYLPLMAIAALLMVPALFALSRRAPKATVGIVLLLAVVLAAATASRNRDYATELALAESNLAHWPTDVAHGMVGSALMQLHRHDEALEELRLAARTAPRSRYNLGSELYNLKRMDDAIAELEAFAGENPMDELAPSARRILGDAFVTQRKWEEAVKQYRLALSMISNDQATKQNMLGAMNNQGMALAASGRFGEAASIFRTVVESDPADLGARRNLTAALLDSQDPRSAETEARKAIEASPGTAVFYDLLGRALATQGRYDEAIVQLREALRLAPGDGEIREDLEKVKTGKLKLESK